MKPSRSLSLQKRLIAAVAVLTLVMWGCSALLMFATFSRQSTEWFDDSMQETASLLMSLTEQELLESDGARVGGVAYADEQGRIPNLYFQFWAKDGRLLYKTQLAPDRAFTSKDHTGFTWTDLEQQRWRVYTAWDRTGNIQLQLAEPQSHRNTATFQYTGRLALLYLCMAVVFPFALWWIVRKAFLPVQNLGQALSQRKEGNLTPLNGEDAPTELQPMVHELNRLMTRVGESIDREKRFTADAAHEMKTPLAGVRANAQLLRRRLERQGEESDPVLADIMSGIDRCSRLIEQLLWLARVDGLTRPNNRTPVDMAYAVRKVVQDHAAMAAKAGIELRCDADEGLFVRTEPVLVDIVVRNLIDNALRYSPAGGDVQVRVFAHEDRVCVRVCDKGPGIPLEQKQRIFERFYRGEGVQNREGSGLGLSIVQKIAELEGLSIDVQTGAAGRGTVFTVCGVRCPMP